MNAGTLLGTARVFNHHIHVAYYWLAFVDAVLFFAPADTWPEALAETDVVDAAEDAEERRRGAGLAMGIDAMG